MQATGELCRLQPAAEGSESRFGEGPEIGRKSMAKWEKNSASEAERKAAMNTSRLLIRKKASIAKHYLATFAGGRSKKSSSSSSCSIFISIMLPFLIVFLMPSLKLLQPEQLDEAHKEPARATGGSSLNPLFSELVLTLARFPFDRFRLFAGLTGASAKEISSKHDLQEEETQLLPAEHRTVAYLGSGSPGSGYRQQVSRSPGYGSVAASGAAGGDQSGELAGSDYGTGDAPMGNQGADMQAGIGSVEPAGSAEQQAAAAGQLTASSSAALQTRNDLPAVRALNVKCEKNHMTVNIVFDRPFYGMVFSKGHYNDQKCVHLPANSGQTSVNFDIHLGKCGMSSSDAQGGQQLQTQLQQSQQQQQQPNGLFIENTIIIQYDPQVQEIYDQARKLRCTWYDYYEKSVSFRPYNVDMLDAVTANFLGDNIQCWMQIQVGKGPWSSEVAGIVKIGQTMTMVLAIKDDENRFDMLVRNCVAHDGKHQPIQLVDEYGCVVRPKIMAKFQKVRNFGPAATVVSYAHFQAFKFPDSMSVHFQCVIQVCRYECPEPVCTGQQQSPAGLAGGSDSPASAPPADYATSGTEMVASKELPQQVPYFHLASSSNHSSAGAGRQPTNSVQLKLDESQGRVQVKVDTSMMAGLARPTQIGLAAASANGGPPPPPHLLHLASGEPQATAASYVSPAGGRIHSLPQSGHTYLGPSPASNYYRSPSSGGATSVRSAPNSGRASPQVALALAPPPSASPHPIHYSSPYSSAYRTAAFATNRLGEQAAPANQEPASVQVEASEQLLSLLAAPRALKTPPAPNHRYRRASEPSEAPKSRRNQNRPAESTTISTQRSIQVVSPDDVAFSLLSAPEEFGASAETSYGASRQRSSQSAASAGSNPSNVCFSASKLALVVVATISALAASMLLVVAAMLRQRARQRLEEKLAGVCDPFAAPELARGVHEASQQQVAGGQIYGLGEQCAGELARQAAAAAARQRRQADEIQQRQNYLARLYSQFVPASYWR